MIANRPTMIVPLRTGDEGVIYVSNTRITRDTVLARYSQGDSPEAIQTGFPTLPLTDIYAVIAYYLSHRDDIDAYLKRRDEEAERVRQNIEASYTPELRLRIQHFMILLARIAQAD